MHFRRLLALISVALLGLLGVASPAAAQDDDSYGERQNFISASSNSACVGDTISFAAGYFQSGSTVAVEVNGNSAGSATANSEGVATFPLTFDNAGTFEVTASGQGDDGEVRESTTVTIRNCDDGGAGAGEGARPGTSDGVTFGSSDGRGTGGTGGGLPRTGTDIVSMGLVAGGVLVLVGAVLVGTMARRRGTGLA